METLVLLAAVLAVAACSIPLLPCPATRKTWTISLGQHDAEVLARVLQALLKGITPPGRVLRLPCGDCDGRGRISLWRKWAQGQVLTK